MPLRLSGDIRLPDALYGNSWRLPVHHASYIHTESERIPALEAGFSDSVHCSLFTVHWPLSAVVLEHEHENERGPVRFRF